MQMRDPLHFALLKVITVMKIMDRMLFPQTYQSLIRQPRRRTYRKQYRTANIQGRCTDLLLSSEIW